MRQPENTRSKAATRQQPHRAPISTPTARPALDCQIRDLVGRMPIRGGKVRPLIGNHQGDDESHERELHKHRRAAGEVYEFLPATKPRRRSTAQGMDRVPSRWTANVRRTGPAGRHCPKVGAMSDEAYRAQATLYICFDARIVRYGLQLYPFPRVS